MPTYRVKPGYRHGRHNQHGPGDTVELTEREAAPILDKVELVREEAASPDLAEPATSALDDLSDDELKARAKEAGIDYYWQKKRETLLEELGELDGPE